MSPRPDLCPICEQKPRHHGHHELDRCSTDAAEEHREQEFANWVHRNNRWMSPLR
ncbi:MAG TPA: hypothetical protein PL156_10690 [Rhodoglobus sp.]|nr:hypothetical protein [Rhodoglobus sp.]